MCVRSSVEQVAAEILKIRAAAIPGLEGLGWTIGSGRKPEQRGRFQMVNITYGCRARTAVTPLSGWLTISECRTWVRKALDEKKVPDKMDEAGAS